MQTVFLHLQKENSRVTVPIIPNNTTLGQKWFSEVKYVVDNYGGNIDDNNEQRLYNIPHNDFQDEDYVGILNNIIQRINNSQMIFNFVLIDLNQDIMNILHHEFELFTYLTGEEQNQKYSLDSQNAFEFLNVVIHKWESKDWIPRIVAQIKSARVSSLEKDDYLNWTTKWEPGSVALNYCLTGKKIVDVWRDEDEVIHDENIRPQNVYSASFQILFGPGYFCNREQEELFETWWKDNNIKLKALGFISGRGENAIGEGIVGRLRNTCHGELENISGATKILGVTYEE